MKPSPFMNWPHGGLGRFIAKNPDAEFVAKLGIGFLALSLMLQFVGHIKTERIVERKSFILKLSAAMLSLAVIILFALMIWSITADVNRLENLQ